MATFKRWVRPIALLLIGVTLVTLLVAWSEVRGEQRAFQRDVQRRAEALAGAVTTLQDVSPLPGRTAQLWRNRSEERRVGKECRL